MASKLVKVKSFGRTHEIEKKALRRYKEVMWLKKIFDEHDENGDGSVSIEEFFHSMEKDYERRRDSRTGKVTSRATRAHMEESMFNVVDKNGDNKLVFSEYLKAYFPDLQSVDLDIMLRFAYPPDKIFDKTAQLLQEMETAREIYGCLQKDHNGMVSREELATLGYTEEEVDNLFDIYDKNHDNGLSLDEYLAMYEKEYLPACVTSPSQLKAVKH